MIAFLYKRIKLFYRYFKIDTPLLLLIAIISALGLLVLYSSSGGSLSPVYKQLTHLALATGVMLVVAQIPPLYLKRSAPILMVIGIFLLIMVLFFGSSSGGAQRWLNLGLVKFQPSEMMRVIVPIAIASILSERTMPPRAIPILISLGAIASVVLLIAKQPEDRKSVV